VTVPWESLLEGADGAAGRLVGTAGNTEPIEFGPNEISTPVGKLVVFSAWLLVAFRKMDALAGVFTAVTVLVAAGVVFLATGGGSAVASAPILGDLPPRVAFLVLAAVLVAGATAVGIALPDRFQRPSERDRVVPALDRLRRSPGSESGVSAPDPSPSNPVERAWWDVTRRVDRESWATRTPREIEREAVDADLSPGAVRDLRRLFEEVRYGDASASGERERRARELRDRLDGSPGSGRGDEATGRRRSDDRTDDGEGSP
jgi:hypothetical protein